jgi:hypothetical protein
MSRTQGWITRILLFALLLLPAALPLPAQTTGAVEGRVTDSSGAALPGVAIEASSASLQGMRVATTGQDGAYHLPGMPPGMYKIKASLQGFGPAENTTPVSLDATATVNFSLEVAAREEVLVSGDMPLVDVTSTTSGTSYTDRVIAQLPVARNYADIVRANPGVSSDRALTLGRSLALTFYGSTSVENLYLIDGVNTTNVIYGIQGKVINNEFVQDVEVKSGGYSAEYGWAMGGVINVITHSGGNEFHGGAFTYYDPPGGRAQQVVTASDSPSGMRVTPEARWDAGASLGGFVVKDRLWFFGAYERVNAPSTSSRYFPGKLVPTSQQFPTDQTDTLYSGKLTGNLASGTTVVASVFADPSKLEGAILGRVISNPDPGTWQAGRTIGGLDYALRASQLVGSSFFATVQASHHRDSYHFEPTGAGGSAIRFVDATCEGGTPEQPCQPADPPNAVFGGIGYIDGPDQNNQSRRTQVRGDASFYLGRHELKAGAEYQDDRTEAVFLYTGGQQVTLKNEHGQQYYQHDFYARALNDLTPVAGAPARVRALRYAAYLQDSFRPAAGWTLNVGLRWSESDVRNDVDRTVLKTAAEWQPRLGVVWDPGKDGKTKAYVSAGRFYYALPLDFAARVFAEATYATTFNFDPANVSQAPDVIDHPEPYVFSNSPNAPVDAGIKGIYQDELTVGVERLLTPDLSIGLKGTYRRLGRTIEDRCDLDYNSFDTGGYACAIANPGSGGRFARGDMPTCSGLHYPYSECSDHGVPMEAARRLYRGIEVLARYQKRDRLWLQASYVYSSLRGNYDGLANFLGQTNPGILIDYDLPGFTRNNYGPLSLDHTHQARVDATYSFPVGLLVGLDTYVRSGRPLNQLGVAFNDQGFVVPVYLVPRGSAGRMPTLWESDLTLGWPFSFGSLVVKPQVYVYNVFNRQTPTYVNEFYRLEDPPGYPQTLYDPVVPPAYVSPSYRKVIVRQDPRLFRAAIRVSF